MKKDYTDITVVLDRSGSMSSVADDTIGGFNRFLADQKAVPGFATITLVQFDDQYDVVIDAKPIADAAALTRETFVPRGSTALLDAIGKTIVRTGQRLAAMSEGDRPANVLFVIITDGFENASREYSRDKVFAQISEQRSKYNWQFMFLGANQDAIAEATKLGMSAGSSLTYANNAAGNVAAYQSVTRAVTQCRVSGDALAFNASDRDAQMQAANS